jgi:hypothetical protein
VKTPPETRNPQRELTANTLSGMFAADQLVAAMAARKTIADEQPACQVGEAEPSRLPEWLSDRGL